MFETLTDRLNETFARLGRKGRLTEQDVDDAMREVRRALLEADVNFKVAKDFVAAVRERAVGQDVLHSLTPAQTVIGIANEELIRVLGEEGQGLHRARPAAADPDAGRTPGKRQDDACRQACRPPAQAGAQSSARGRRRLPPGRNQPAAGARQADQHPGLRRRDRPQSGRYRRQRGAVRPRAWLQPDHHRHRRPLADRRPSHARAGQHPGPGAIRPRSCWSPTP